MDIETKAVYLEILKEELVPAMGCTEPISVALAGALARRTLGQIPEAVKHERVKRLYSLQENVQARLLNSYIGSTLTILFETFENGVAIGHSSNFIEVAVSAKHSLHAKALPVKILSAENVRCIGELVEVDPMHIQ